MCDVWCVMTVKSATNEMQQHTHSDITVTKSMEHSPSWEANSSSSSQEIPCILWNSKVHDHIHKTLLLSISWIRSVQSMPPHHTSRSILILSSHQRPGLPSGSFPKVSPPKPCIHLSSSDNCYMPSPSHSLFDHPNNTRIWWAVQSVQRYRAYSGTGHTAVQGIQRDRAYSSTGHTAPRYVISTILSLRPC
jgi:hypothetical protein